MTSDSRIALTVDGMIGTITLNRPEKLNALDPAMLEALADAALTLDRDRSVRVVLLTGAGEKAFCVGADINAWGSLDPLGMWAEWVRNGHRIFNLLASLRQPLIAVLNGYTFGGGLELALAADMRLAADTIELAMPEVRLGTVPGWGGTARLPALIGAARAKQMIFSGGRITAAKAEAWGLVNALYPSSQLLASARALADEIAANAPTSIQMAKQMIDGGFGVAFESIAAAATASTEDGREGLSAFREKRPPQFTGK